MNKKISTFLAGIALFGAVSAGATTPVTSLTKTSDKLYQLEVDLGEGTGYLSMSENGALFLEDDIASVNLANSLWCVEVTEEGSGKAPIFDFTNKATGQRLDIQYAGTLLEGLEKNVATVTDLDADSTFVGGEISGWAFSTQYTANLQPERTLYSYIKPDSVIGLVKDESNKILIKKMGASDAYADAEDADGVALTKFTLVEADVIRLGANEINTYFGLQSAKNGVALTFNPDEMGTKVDVPNPFNGKNVGKFFAEAIDSDDDYVYILNGDSSYLRVDTSIVNASGEKFRAFFWDNLKYAKLQASGAGTKPTSPADSISRSSIEGQYKFAFSYYPSKDSLVIQVAEALNYVDEAVDGSHWVADEEGEETTKLPEVADGVETKGENNFVTVQDLIKDQVRIITINDKKETDISFGYKGCQVVESDKVSLADGVYTIRNAKGQYFAVPISVDCVGEGYLAGWSSIDEPVQDVSHMPAYQWVITKTKTSEYAASTSPIELVNREYPFAWSWGTVQLYKDEDGSLYFYNGDEKLTLTFEKVADEIISDPNLGYRYMSKEELMISNYAFNYYTPFSENNYVNILGGDSVLNVLNDAEVFFGIEPVSELGYDTEEYGILVSKELKARIPALAQLERAPYYIYRIDANGKKAYAGVQNDYMYEGNLDGRVVISSNLENPTPFYFKENNHYNKKHYYAFVLASDRERGEANVASMEWYNNKFAVEAGEDSKYYPECTKVGVADQSSNAILQYQCGCEARTSAFSIGLAEQPLYRRFNSLALEGNEGDAADTLRFIEKYRNEYLQMEVNPNFMFAGINFLGIDGAEKAVDGKSFYVDSVWVERGLGYIKPQYLVSIDREPAKTTTIKIPCPICQAEIEAGHEAPENCIHDKYVDVEGYERGHYLVNFADSTANNNYMWGKYNRVGFVDALHIGDSLYLLIDQFAGVKTENVDIAAIIAANTKKGGIANGTGYYIKNLKGDAHKYYTWSFRFIDPTIAADEVESSRSFLFESMAHADQPQIAPERASWLKMQNGCLVMSDPAESTFANAKTGGDDALIFNVEEGSKDDIATDNEVISVEGVNVIAKVGAVRVSGAEGKKVVITNILGQVVANTVITSDDATIAVPAGMVIVAVDGEEAVKAIVK